MTEDAHWFAGPSGPLLGHYHLPSTGPVSAVGVLLCPPVGIELQASYSTLRELARKLARAGVPTLRFDYEGTGDSAGEFLEHGSTAWLESIVAGATELRRTGIVRLALVGLRLGATLAASVAPQLPDLAGLVLWDPCTSGRSFLRGQQALLKLTSSAESEDGAEETQTAGYVYEASSAAEVRSLRLPLETIHVPSLVLVRQPDASWLSDLAGRPDVEIALAPDQDRLLAEGVLRDRVPESTLDAIVGWVLTRSNGSEISRQAISFSRRAEIDRTTAGAITEEVILIGDHRLFGVRTEPPASDPARPIALFLNTADSHHIGVCRTWVTYARALARNGVTAVRIDLSGLGDSNPREDWPPNTVGAPPAIDDVLVAVSSLSMRNAGPVVPIGLCSGAYTAAEAALKLKLPHVLMINPAFSFQPPEMLRGKIDPRRNIRVARRGWLRRLQRSQQRSPSSFDNGSHVRRWQCRPPLLAWWILDALHVQRSPSRVLLALSRSTKRTRLICGPAEARTNRTGTPIRLALALRSKRIDLQIVPDLDHALWDRRSREVLGNLLIREFTAPLGAE